MKSEAKLGVMIIAVVFAMLAREMILDLYRIPRDLVRLPFRGL